MADKDFDAACADGTVKLLGELRHKLAVSDDDFELMTRMLWLLGQTPAITNDAQRDAYVEQLAEILVRRRPGQPDGDTPARFYARDGEGALATALMSRIQEWEQKKFKGVN